MPASDSGLAVALHRVLLSAAERADREPFRLPAQWLTLRRPDTLADELDPVEVEEVVARRPAGDRPEHQEYAVRPRHRERHRLARPRAGAAGGRQVRRRQDRPGLPSPVLTSTAASGEPTVLPLAASATRNVTELMFCRLNGPLSSIQSPLVRLPRCSPPPSSVLVARLVPDWLSACSTCCLRWRIRVSPIVVSDGTPPGPPLSV